MKLDALNVKFILLFMFLMTTNCLMTEQIEKNVQIYEFVSLELNKQLDSLIQLENSCRPNDSLYWIMNNYQNYSPEVLYLSRTSIIHDKYHSDRLHGIIEINKDIVYLVGDFSSNFIKLDTTSSYSFKLNTSKLMTEIDLESFSAWHFCFENDSLWWIEDYSFPCNEE